MAAEDKKGPDMELRKAFVELHIKVNESKQKMKMADLQIENLKRSIVHTELTEAELKTLPEETRLYQSVGRMFLLSSKTDVDQMLEKKRASSQDKIKNLQANKTYLERNLKDSENSLREIINQKLQKAQ